ncbi:MAG: hypothetical protein IT567_03600 [Alphaproteobacteria bacterium]|nr:hypothetical protein [Alphaproteobacteria bacterium]
MSYVAPMDALQEAAFNGNVAYLKEAMASPEFNPNHCGENGYSILGLALEHPEFVALLLSRADINPNIAMNTRKSITAMSVLDEAIMGGAPGGVERNWREYQKSGDLLMAHPAIHLEAKNQMGFTPLHMAAMSGNLHAAESLKSHGANVMAMDNDGHTPGDIAGFSKTSSNYKRTAGLSEAMGALLPLSPENEKRIFTKKARGEVAGILDTIAPGATLRAHGKDFQIELPFGNRSLGAREQQAHGVADILKGLFRVEQVYANKGVVSIPHPHGVLKEVLEAEMASRSAAAGR